MARLRVDEDVEIDYGIAGEGDPIVLIHGFASSRQTNWVSTNWIATLTGAGRQVISFDVRGHGLSSKPHRASTYEEGGLASDVVRLLDKLGHERADVMGYSMGGFILMRLLRDYADRIRRAVIAGVGENYYGRGQTETHAIADALRAPDRSTLPTGVPKQFRLFAEQGRNDLEALALCMTRERRSFGADDYRGLQVPVLLIVGENDTITGPADVLQSVLPGSQLSVIPRRDHMTAVGDKVFKAEVLKFLSA